MDELKAKKLLFEVADCLEELDFSYFLYGGTLLGAIREKKFIEIDRDIDLGCLMEDFKPRAFEIRDKFLANDIRFEFVDHRHKAPWDGTPYCIKFYKYGEHGDFVAWTKKDKDRFCPSHANDYALIHPALLLEELGQVEFYGRTFSIPKDFDTFLKHKYGDWRTPHKKFYNLSRPGCRVYNYDCQI